MAIDVYREWLGIPEGPRPPDHYQLLRLVQFEDAADKIRANYKKLNAHVRKYASGQYSVESQDLLNELAKAMLCLVDVERKREYDKGLGREFEEERTPSGRRPMESLLVEQQLISEGQLKEARDYADRSGLSLRDALVQMKMVEPAAAAQAYAEELGIPYLDLTDLLPDDDVLDRVPRKLVKQHSFLPLFVDQDRLIIAAIDLIDHEIEDDLRMRFDVPVRCVLAAPFAINQAISKYYAPGLRNEVVEEVKPNSTKGATAKKVATTTAAPKAAAPRRASALSPEERKQRQQLGMIGFCWSFVLAYGLNWLLSPANAGFSFKITLPVFVIVPGLTGIYVWQTCFKK